MKNGKWSLSSLEKRLSQIEKSLDLGNIIMVFFDGEKPDTKENEEDVIEINLYWPDVSSKRYDSQEKDDKILCEK